MVWAFISTVHMPCTLLLATFTTDGILLALPCHSWQNGVRNAAMGKCLTRALFFTCSGRSLCKVPSKSNHQGRSDFVLPIKKRISHRPGLTQEIIRLRTAPLALEWGAGYLAESSHPVGAPCRTYVQSPCALNAAHRCGRACLVAIDHPMNNPMAQAGLQQAQPQYRCCQFVPARTDTQWQSMLSLSFVPVLHAKTRCSQEQPVSRCSSNLSYFIVGSRECNVIYCDPR